MSKAAKQKQKTAGFVFKRKQLFDSLENLSVAATETVSSSTNGDRMFQRNVSQGSQPLRASFDDRMQVFEKAKKEPTIKTDEKKKVLNTFKDKVAAFEQITGQKGGGKSSVNGKLQGKWRNQVKTSNTAPKTDLTKWHSLPVLDNTADVLDIDNDPQLQTETATLLTPKSARSTGCKIVLNGDPKENKKQKPHWTTVFSQRISMIRQKLESRCATEKSKTVQQQLRQCQPPKRWSGAVPSYYTSKLQRSGCFDKEWSSSCQELSTINVNFDPEPVATASGLHGYQSDEDLSYRSNRHPPSNTVANGCSNYKSKRQPLFDTKELQDKVRQKSVERRKELKLSSPSSQNAVDTEHLQLPTATTDTSSSLSSDSDSDDDLLVYETTGFIQRAGKPLTPVPWKKSKLRAVHIEGTCFTSISEENKKGEVFRHNWIQI